MTANAEPVIIVGAGAAGLAVADALGRRGIAAVVLEKAPHVAEPWRRRHQRLSLNTHRDLSYLPGMRFPAGTPAFPARQTVIDYLERFAAERGIRIEFGVEVERLDRSDGHWQLQTSAGPRQAGEVIIATGRDRLPWTPDWPGLADFGGRLVHAADFGRMEDYAGKKVLVAGAGNSGFDVLNHLSRGKAAHIWLSARNGPSLLPKRIANVAVQRLGLLMQRLPLRLADAAIAATQRLALGDLKRYGLPPAPKGGASRLAKEHIAIATDDGAVRAIKAGRVEVVAPVARFTADGVILANGSTVAPDVVIAATGYRTGLEGMVGDLGVLDGKGVPKATGDEPTGQPGLWFIGMKPAIAGNFHAASVQAKAIADRLAASRRTG
ncbi:NAD(P)/FAD-dependent oxidoreductase [Mesorhizobium sp. SP-1A]|uniref:flavin-containing monooxygenase n=1 Tax=Mesorhizobium sp. SP-1A TaxID=3077840 RepID=UPI0028F6E881|nr:NAD(P)/FAD-dependent oxidoreductase [Mesorhizobium sp. SP-1A]